MAGKFARSWELMKASGRVLKQDKTLMLFPLLSGLCSLIVVASFFIPVVVFFMHNEGHQLDQERLSPLHYVGLFAFYLVQYTVIFFFNTALVSAALVRLRGGVPTVGGGIRAAMARFPAILGYALIAATVGVFLRALQERLGFVGRLVAGLLGLGWTVATFLVVPVLASQNVGPVDALKRSVQLLRKTWGENLIGNGGLGLVFGFISFGIIIAGMALVFATLATQSYVVFAIIGVLTFIALLALSLIQAALQGIYSAALYRFAEEGEAGAGFEPALLEGAFRSK
ncbi:hypothetical protein EC912_102489 [Luteibacter rhizovicinus]|uniref:Glycerophosphoryl diester phosphodiesterase family protein n=1 Tax=Luteibacter rhizovicinus TaxID=242606 RepID=A0A4V2W4J4_9GAMM|nr:DUF6159 family protein [Luteibacter rhizovicinus]TCV96139.1 hypothetical protein EC912_102489 [Luteibacter rhizovicinus]